MAPAALAKRGEVSCNRKPREGNRPGRTSAARKLGETRGLAKDSTSRRLYD